MSGTSLHEALREAAATVTGYETLDGAMRDARRMRRRRLIALPIGAAAAVLLIVALVVPVISTVDRTDTKPADSPPVTLPTRLEMVRPSTPFLSAKPGPAAVVFGSNSPPLLTLAGNSRLGLLGPQGYRMSDVVTNADEIHPGEPGQLLSPAGDRIVVGWDIADKGNGPCAYTMIDLLRGRNDRVVPPDQGYCRDTTPLAWSPDGRTLLVAKFASGSLVRWDSLALQNADSGEYRRLTAVEPPDIVNGPVPFNAAAFSRDGSRVAYQSGSRLVVLDLGGKVQSTATLPAGARLSGKGSWTPDGRAIVIAVPGEASGRPQWSFETVDAATGKIGRRIDLPTISDAATVRMLGWSAGGSAVVVAFRPEAASLAKKERKEILGGVAFEDVRAIEVLSLSSGAGEPQPILRPQPTTAVLAIDIADRAITRGPEQEGSPAASPEPVQSGLQPDEVLDLRGLGPYRIATTFTSLKQAGRLTRVASEKSCPGRFDAEATGKYAAHARLTFRNGRLAAVRLVGPDLTFLNALEIGMPLTQMREFFGADLFDMQDSPVTVVTRGEGAKAETLTIIQMTSGISPEIGEGNSVMVTGSAAGLVTGIAFGNHAVLVQEANSATGCQ